MLRTLKNFDARSNSIGTLRFMCAMLVLVSHDYGLGGFNAASEPIVALSHNQWSLGTVAVCSFFFLSGFLVTKSFLSSNDVVRFLWHRILRIFPAYWLCLIVTAFGVGGALYFAVNGNLGGFLNPGAENSPWGFITNNYTLDVYQFDVLHLVRDNPYKLGINGSLWTLGNEFRCYLFLALIGLLGILLRARIAVLAMCLILWLISVSPQAFPQLVATLPPLGKAFEQTYAFEEMAVYFFAGSVAFLYAEKIPVRIIPAIAALVIGIASFPFPWFRIVMPLALSYVLIWILMQPPPFRFSRGVDYSYGIYLYAFPMSQYLAFYQVYRFGFPAYVLLTALLTTAFAAASWHLVERPILALKNVAFPTWLRLSTPAALADFLAAVNGRMAANMASTIELLVQVRNNALARWPRRPQARKGSGARLERIVALGSIAVIAYATAMLAIFPHYVAPLAAHHSDMYIAPDLAANPFGFERLLRAARPVIWIVEQYAGYLGFEGSVAAFIVLAILDLVLALYILERYFVRQHFPIWISYLTFLFAMSAPGFYINAGYDIGTALGMFFGLLGIVAWEERGNRIALAGILSCALFVLSALSKEGFLPILFVYAIVQAWLSRRKTVDCVVVLLLPSLALIAMLLDAHLANSNFVNVGEGSDSPYFVSLSPQTIIGSLQFYFAPLTTPFTIAFVCLAIVASWTARRGRMALCILVSALSLQAPYLILPNHRLGYYWWVAIPILMLLIPVALSPTVSSTVDALGARIRYRRISVAAAFCALLVSIAQFAPTDAADESWFLTQQKINEAMLQDLRSARVEIDRAQRILVVGLSFPFEPWSHAGFVSKELGFSGQWTIATEPGQAPVPDQPNASAIDYGDVRWTNYDLVLVFGPYGHLVGAYSPSAMSAAATARHLGKRDTVALVESIRSHPIREAEPVNVAAMTPSVPSPDADSITYPPDVLSGKTASLKGIYPADGAGCCWAAADSQFEIDDASKERSIVLRVYVPATVPMSAAPTSLDILSPRGKSVGHASIGVGLRDVTFTIPAGDVTGGRAMIRLHTDKSFVPRDLGLDSDPRHLSFLLVSAHLR